MNEIESRSELAVHRSAKSFFVPSWAEISLYVLISVILLIVLNVGSVLKILGGDYVGNPENISANFSTLLSRFSNSFNLALGGRLGQIMLWSFVGALCYIGLWLVKNVLNSFENDVISDHYLHPSGYSRAGYWGSSFSIKAFFLALLLITAAFFFVIITAVLPSVALLAGSASYNFHALTSPLYILFAIAGVALVLYIAGILLRLIAHMWKLL